MTSGKFRSVPLSSITISPDRQRKELAGIEELGASIARNGLINPILVTEDLVLVAGERRLTACRALGWTAIPVHFTSDLSPHELEILELEENVKRVDLSWQEHVSAVTRYHNICKQDNPSWTMADTAEALSVSPAQITRLLAVGKAMEEGDQAVLNADKLSVARGIVERKASRKEGALTELVSSMIPSPARSITASPDGVEQTLGEDFYPVEAAGEEEPWTPFLHQDFSSFETTARFNFLHCDFPYGVNANKHAQGAGQAYGTYEDSADVYFQLLDTLARFCETNVADSAHLMFWFSMDFYSVTKERLEAMEWRVNPFPLIWFKSDNSGILPDPKRGPRRNYETAFLCSRGDRQIVRAVSNVCASPNTKLIHMSEKPVPMLAHFFRMFVDESTVMLDPTMGSGNSVRVSEAMGASHSLGLERDETFYRNAVENYLSNPIDIAPGGA